jgi:precorrin-6B methylase 2
MLFSEEKQAEFLKRIDAIVIGGGVGYIEAVILACEENEIEPNVASRVLSQPIIEKIEEEAREYNMFSKNTAKLPI